MLGCLFDVHGNLPALEAVLADARARGVERFVLGGDYSAFGAWPAECVAALDALDVELRIRGNWERWVADPPPDVRVSPETMAAGDAVRAAIGDSRVDELGALSDTAWLGTTLVCHASPGSDMDGFAVQVDESDAQLLRGVDAPRLVFGHTHRQFHRVAAGSGQELLNPGSVGMPLDGDQRAAWAVLDGGVELRRVSYDVDLAVDGLRTRYGDEPWADTIIGRLRSASM
jgi:diadenosine tetraphosphatase ApaH/serine/threonine PP2A family protein phosphatase